MRRVKADGVDNVERTATTEPDWDKSSSTQRNRLLLMGTKVMSAAEAFRFANKNYPVYVQKIGRAAGLVNYCGDEDALARAIKNKAWRHGHVIIRRAHSPEIQKPAQSAFFYPRYAHA